VHTVKSKGPVEAIDIAPGNSAHNKNNKSEGGTACKRSTTYLRPIHHYFNPSLQAHAIEKLIHFHFDAHPLG
jgi:hypothetical protein